MTPEQVKELVERLNSTERTAHDARALMRDAASALTLLSEEREELREALKPFVNAFMARRDTYIRRYGVDEELGARRFDAMPDAWEMEGLTFCMGRYRRARAALKDT